MQIDNILQTGAEKTGFRHRFNKDGLFGDGDAFVHLFAVVGRVDDGDLQVNCCRVVFQLTNKGVRRLEFVGIEAVGVSRTGHFKELDALDIGDKAFDVDLPTGHRFAKEILGIDRPGDHIAGQVERFGALEVDGKAGQGVRLHLDGAAAGDWPHFRG